MDICITAVNMECSAIIKPIMPVLDLQAQIPLLQIHKSNVIIQGSSLLLECLLQAWQML